METLPKLTPTQSLLLRAAARRADGSVIVPNTLRGGARAKTLAGLLRRGWIETVGDGHALTNVGYAVIGRQRPAPPNDVQPIDAAGELRLPEGVTMRPGTKLAALVIALRRPEGSAVAQICAATGWQPHTVRGAISGMLRKRLGLNVVLIRNISGERVYHIG